MHAGQESADDNSGARLITAGTLTGSLELVAEPAHTQVQTVHTSRPEVNCEACQCNAVFADDIDWAAVW